MNGKPVTSMVHQRLYDDIINGVVTVNDILTESSLAERFSVSKAPVREALISLCGDHLLQSIPRTGYKVVQIMPEEAAQLSELRLAIETFLLNKAFPALGLAQVEQLEALHAHNLAEEQVRTTVQDHWRRNMAFHQLLASFGGNELMARELERVLASCARAATQYFLGRRKAADPEDLHGPLIHALRAGDRERAQQLLQKDIAQVL